MTIEAPFAGYRDTVRPEWIDYSGHMNLGYYLLAFEQAAICFFDVVDLSERYRDRTGRALFAAEVHISFERELREGAHSWLPQSGRMLHEHGASRAADRAQPRA